MFPYIHFLPIKFCFRSFLKFTKMIRYLHYSFKTSAIFITQTLILGVAGAREINLYISFTMAMFRLYRLYRQKYTNWLIAWEMSACRNFSLRLIACFHFESLRHSNPPSSSSWQTIKIDDEVGRGGSGGGGNYDEDDVAVSDWWRLLRIISIATSVATQSNRKTKFVCCFFTC